KCVFVARLLFGSEFALRMSVEISPITSQREHEQQLGVHAGRGNATRAEMLDGRVEGFTEEHEPILVVVRRSPYVVRKCMVRRPFVRGTLLSRSERVQHLPPCLQECAPFPRGSAASRQ